VAFYLTKNLIFFLQDNPQDVIYWQMQMELEFGSQHATTDEEKSSVAAAASAAQQPPANAKACRYGSACTRPDCKFWHPEPDEINNVHQNEDISNKCARLGQSWVPHQVLKS
jgi:hypothetical protein